MAAEQHEALPAPQQPVDAGFWLRVGASLVDDAVVGLPGIALVALTAWLNACRAPYWLAVGGLALGAAGSLVYVFAMTWRRGQTVGQMAADIQVVTAQGSIPSGPRAFWRTFCLAIPALCGVGRIGSLLGLADVLWVACSKRKRALHDVAAGTFVLRLGRGPCRGFVPLAVAAYAVPTLLILAVIRPLVLQAYYVPSGAMEPALREGDRLLANQLTPRLRPMRVGEVIVFWAPETAGPSLAERPLKFVQRVVGVPGDRLRVSGGVLYRNGQAVDEPYTRERKMVRPWPDGADEGAEVIVPAGKLVVMGDNRNNSNDSRRWGRYGPGDTFTPDPFLPAESVEGRVIFRFAPLRRMGNAGME